MIVVRRCLGFFARDGSDEHEETKIVYAHNMLNIGDIKNHSL